MILAVAIVAGAVALGLSLRQEDSYQATASISFQGEASALDLIGDGQDNGLAPEQTPQARAEAIVEPATVDAVAEGLDLTDQRADLAGSVSTSIAEGSFLVDVTATWSSPDLAARIANEFGRQAVRRINFEARSEFRSTLREVRSRINGLDGKDPADAVERSALIAQEVRFTFLSQNSTPASLAARAQPPASPVSPLPVRNAVIGLALGLILGLVAAFLRDSFDRRVRGLGEIQQEASFPVVGHLRADALGSVLQAGTDDSFSDGQEQIRIIRQNIRFLDVDRSLNAILVTSALPEEGKSTVAAGLAFASAIQGEDVLLLECDLRRPTLATRIEVEPSPGLADLVTGDADLASIFRVLPVESIDRTNGSKANQDDLALSLVPAGSISRYPAELLQSERFTSFFEAISNTYDTIIIDSSPLLPVADTLELIPVVDCILLCVRSGQSNRDELKEAKRVLDLYPSKPTGLVVTGLTEQDLREYGYYSYSAYAPYATAGSASDSGMESAESGSGVSS